MYLARLTRNCLFSGMCVVFAVLCVCVLSVISVGVMYSVMCVL